MVIIDVMIVASGFVLRAMAGALAIDVPISPWLYVCVTLLALFLALQQAPPRTDPAQRRARAATARSWRSIRPRLLDQMISVVTAETVMAYALYTFTAENLPERKPPDDADHPLRPLRHLPLPVPDLPENEGGTPEELLLRDRPLLVSVVLWGLTAVVVLTLARIYNLPLQ